MKALVALVLVTVSFLAAPAGAREKKQQPQFKLVEFQMALLKRGPRWSSGGKDAALQQQHAYVQSLLTSGKLVIAGPLKDDGEVQAVYILRAKSADEARTWVMADPAVSGGHFVPEMHPWWAEDVMKPATSPQQLSIVYLAFLTRGPKWTPTESPELEELQKAHLANIQRLATMKKLVVAGPFDDEGNLRGIFVFRVDTLAEAKN